MDPIKQEYDLNEESSRKVCELIGVEYRGPMRLVPAPALTRAMIAAGEGKTELAIAHFVEHLTNLVIEEQDVQSAKRIFGELADFPLPLDGSNYIGQIYEPGWERIALYEHTEAVGYVDEGHGIASVVVQISRGGASTYMELGRALEPRIAAVLCVVAARICGVSPDEISIFKRDELNIPVVVEKALGSEEDIAMLVEMVLDIAVEIREDSTHFTYTPTVIKDVVENVLETGIGLSIVERRRAKGRVIQKLRDDDIKFTEPVVDAFFNDLDLQLG